MFSDPFASRGNQLPAFKRRHAVLDVHEFVLDNAFSNPDLVFLDCHGPTSNLNALAVLAGLPPDDEILLLVHPIGDRHDVADVGLVG